MRILHFITSLRTGGAEQLVSDLLPIIQREGEEVSLLLLDGTKTPLFDELESKGIRIVSLFKGWRAMRNPLLVFKLTHFLRKERFDIVHTHNTPCQLMAAAASLFVPSTLVTTEHNTTNKRRTWKVYHPIDRWMYSRYQRIVCVGKETEKALLDYLPELVGKTVIITNGIDLDRFHKATPAKDIEDKHGIRILMAAAFRAQKDHATPIRSMSLLPNSYHLFLAGGAETKEDEKTLQSCKDLVRMMNLEDRVSFLGTRKDIPELLAACDIAVLSSHYEGFGLSALEAMASGKALIASDVDSLTTLVGGAGLLFPQGDASALAERIREVCDNPDQAREIGRRGKERAKGYDITQTARSYCTLYKTLAKSGNPCRKGRK